MTKDNNDGLPAYDQRVTSHSQSGGITAHTVIIGKQRFDLTNEMVAKIVGSVPIGRKVLLRVVGNKRCQDMGATLNAALSARGFSVEHHVIGMLAPPPNEPVEAEDNGVQFTITFAPDA